MINEILKLTKREFSGIDEIGGSIYLRSDLKK